METRSAMPNENNYLQTIFREATLTGCSYVYGDKVVKAWASLKNKRFKFLVPERSFVTLNEGRIIAFSGWPPRGGPSFGACCLYFCPARAYGPRHWQAYP